jgi:Flp pilus assembly protein TadG
VLRRVKIFSRCEGAVAVEAALILPLLLLLILGGMDLSHMYYMEYLASNASREGARYGVKYKINPSTNFPYFPNALTPSISNYVKLPTADGGLGYSALLGSDVEVTPGGPGYTGGLAGQILTVQVTAYKHWFFLGNWMGFTDPKQIDQITAMQLER